MNIPLGFQFGDEVLRGKEREEESSPLRCGKALRMLILVVFVVFAVRLSQLQIVLGRYHRTLSDENRIVARRVKAPRGVISDRRGTALAQNIPVYLVRNPACAVSDSGPSFEENAYCPPFVEIPREEALRRAAREGEGAVVIDSGRQYRFGPELAHVVGYVGEVDREDLVNSSSFQMGDAVGKAGVELVYDRLLRGKDGAELLEIDASSSVVRAYARKDPVHGVDIQLTLDAGLQRRAYELLGEYRGAVVAMDPRSGAVVTLVSKPSFDANDVSSSLMREDQPFFNRAVGGLYPPGSVFKVVTALSGLAEGKIAGETEIEDVGELRVGPYRYGNWYFDQYGRKEGFLNVVGALKRSNDIFFYRVGELVGATTLSAWAKVFGLGRGTGIDLPGESEGLVPSPEWKEKVMGERWFLGNTYHFAIGQSDLEVTPLQMARMTAAVASGGRLCRPFVVDRDRVGRGADGISGDPECESLPIASEYLALVRRGMEEACLPGGTGFPFFNFGITKDGVFQRIRVGCKTGTAEYGDPAGKTHAWFTVYAPSDDPEIVVTVVLEGAGEGAYQAAPVAKAFLEEYFSGVQNEK